MTYVSTKTYGPSEGFTVAYRQWRADRKSGSPAGTPYAKQEIPGCSAIHGYALSFHFEFECQSVDARNWVVDFGSLQPLKQFLRENFDHTMLVAHDDPHHDTFVTLRDLGLCKLVEVYDTGCEALAKMLCDYVNTIFLPAHYPEGTHSVHCRRVEVRETPSNSASFEWWPSDPVGSDGSGSVEQHRKV